MGCAAATAKRRRRQAKLSGKKVIKAKKPHMTKG